LVIVRKPLDFGHPEGRLETWIRRDNEG
jgi:hypothetical protein